jgi:hypothetical protein
MTTSTSSMRHGEGKPRQLEAVAFYHGAHGIDPTPVKDEIEARFLQDALREKEEPVRKLRMLEAKLEQVRKERPEAEAVWQRLKKELGDTPPPYLHAVVMAVFGCFAILVDTILLAPTMDILNIANPFLQYVAAAGFAALFTAWFEHAGLHYVNAKTIGQKRSAIVAGCVGVLSLIFWGLLRGHQLRFAAGLAGNPLGDFLAAHPLLAGVFFIVATLATPMIGAYSLLCAWRDFSAATMWRRVRERFATSRNAELELPKQIQTETESLERFDRRKEAECREWKEIFNHYYDRGLKNGARREPLWSVVWKSVLGVIGGTALAIFMPKAWFPAEFLFPGMSGLGLFLFFNYRRLHPSHERYLARENTKFAVIPESSHANQLPEPTLRLLSKGDHQ